MKYILTLIFLSLLLVNGTKAQFFQTGQDPSRIKWRQINTENFQVIYPEEFEKEAQRLTFVLTRVYEFSSHTMDHAPSKVSVVLHTRTATSNGLVAWAPRRIELFTTPHQQIYSQDWLNQLALHEFRHLLQLDKIQSELPYLLKLLFGEQATAAVLGVYLPLWFLEGDAVVNETALSQTGRGRQASFSMDYRAQLSEKGMYSFDKAYLGSYKDFVPDHYKLGYWLVGKTREKYGPQLWTDVLQRVGRRPWSITPLNSVLKRQTGMNSEQHYRQIFTDLATDWKQDSKMASNRLSFVSPQRKAYTNYRYAAYYRDSMIVAFRTSMDDIARFVLIQPDGREEVLYTPGYVFEESASVTEALIIWSERQPHIRWTHADRSVICIYDIETKKKRRLEFADKLFSPVISPGLTSFAAIASDTENNFFLTVCDLKTGQQLHRVQTADNQYLFTPCWDEKGERLYFVCLSPQGKYLASYDLQSRQLEPLTPPTFADIKNPVFTNNRLIFSADFSGKDNLYSLDPRTRQIFPVVSPAFGADYPSAINSQGFILFSNYTSDGYRLSTLSLKDVGKGQPVTDISLQPNALAEQLSAQEKDIPQLKSADTIRYSSSPYPKTQHLFNFHSWAPAFIDVDNYTIRPGVSLFSQNMLGTADTRLGYDYDVTDKTGKYSAAFNYYGLFPEFNATLSYGNGTRNSLHSYDSIDHKGNFVTEITTLKNYRWNELNADISVRLPLNLSRGKYSIGLYPEIGYDFRYLKPLRYYGDNIYSGDSHAFSYRLYHFNLIRQHTQSLMPKWGYQLDMIYRHTPFGTYRRGTIKGIQTNIYLPGLLKNNGIKIYQGYQEMNFNSTSNFASFVRFPRGMHGYENNKMYALSAEYRMPLLYPDARVGKLLYMKRVKSSFFYDYAWLSTPALNEQQGLVPNYFQFDLNSMGMDLTADFHVLRFFAPLQAGVRYIYLPQTNSIAVNFLFSVDFNGF